MKFMYIIIYNAGFEGKAKGKWEFLKEKKMGRWGPTTWARADSRTPNWFHAKGPSKENLEPRGSAVSRKGKNYNVGDRSPKPFLARARA